MVINTYALFTSMLDGEDNRKFSISLFILFLFTYSCKYMDFSTKNDKTPHLI